MLRLETENEEELVQGVVDFANGHEAEAESDEKDEAFLLGLKRYYDVGDLEKVRAEVRLFLTVASVYYDPRKVSPTDRRRLQKLFRKRIGGVKLVSRVDFVGDELEPRIIAFPRDVKQASWLGIGLCLDREWGFYDRLTLCEERGCSNLVLQKPTGRPVERCDACRADRIREQTRERVRRARIG